MRGNITPHAEYNIYPLQSLYSILLNQRSFTLLTFVDPEAMDVVLHLGVPLVFVPLNVTHQVKYVPDELEQWANVCFSRLARAEALIPFVEDYPIAQFVDHLTVNAMKFYGGYIHMHDPLAVAVATDEDQKLAKRMKRMVRIDCGEEFQGKSYARDCTTEEQVREAGKEGYAPAFVCLEVDPPAVLQIWANQVLKAYHRPKAQASALHEVTT